MSKYFPFFALFLLAGLANTGCGPEAETGAFFSRALQNAGRKNPGTLSTDSVIPEKEQGEKSGTPLNATLDYLTGKFDPEKHPDFVPVPPPYTHKTGMLLRREAYEAFKKMWAAAKQEGVILDIISATRTFVQQKNIWEGKWSRFAADTPEPGARARKILEYSAMPGASRHHWGTDVDLNDLNNPSFEAGGRYEKAYAWLQKHAQEYGFCQPYTPKGPDRPEGYNEEKWHWSYLPVATPLLHQYGQDVRDTMLTGFSGAETAARLHIVEHYALGINQACQ